MKTRAVFLLALLSIFAVSLTAQSYSAVQTSGTYTMRNGAGIAGRWVDALPDGDDNATVVDLPFDFPYFNHTYRQCYVNINGRITFNQPALTTFSAGSLVAPVTGAGFQDTIFAIGADLYTEEEDPSRQVKVFLETNRVVAQWTNVEWLNGSYTLRSSFQIHLESNGVITMVSGGETLPAGFNDTLNYVSGIVSPDGTASFAGFNNTLAVQTARPATGATVTFTPSGFTNANVVRISVGNLFIQPDLSIAPQTNLPITQFQLTAVGSGATITQLRFTHANFSATSIGATFSLVRDTAPLGQYNGEAAIGTATTTTSTTNFTGLSEAITTGSVDYLLLISTTASGQDTIFNEPNISVAGTLPANAIFGWAGSEVGMHSSGPVGVVAVATSDHVFTPAINGSTNNTLMSIFATRGQDSPGFTVDDLTVDLALGGTLTLGDISNLRIYRDGGTIGQFGSGDVLLATVAAPTASNLLTFSASQTLGVEGIYLLVTYDVSAAYAGLGSIEGTITDGSLTPALSVINPINSTGNVHAVRGTGTSVFLRPRNDVQFFNVPAQPSDTFVIANAFSLETTSGTAALTSLVFNEINGPATTGIAAARLYLDNGTLQGQYDTGDTLVMPAGTINAGDITFAALVGQTLSTTRSNYILTLDLTAGAGGSGFQFLVQASGVTAGATVFGPDSPGPFITVGMGVGAAGVDITVNVNNNLNFGGNQQVWLCTAQCTARGAGGFPPELNFSWLDAVGGMGNSTFGLQTLVYLEGAGPLGQLDGSDILLYPISGGITDLELDGGGAVGVVTTGSTRNFLVLVRKPVFNANAPLQGSGRLLFRGVNGGTNVRLNVGGALPVPGTIAVNVAYNNVGGGGKGGDDGGGCSTGESAQGGMLALLGALGLLFVGLRAGPRFVR